MALRLLRKPRVLDANAAWSATNCNHGMSPSLISSEGSVTYMPRVPTMAPLARTTRLRLADGRLAQVLLDEVVRRDARNQQRLTGFDQSRRDRRRPQQTAPLPLIEELGDHWIVLGLPDNPDHRRVLRHQRRHPDRRSLLGQDINGGAKACLRVRLPPVSAALTSAMMWSGEGRHHARHDHSMFEGIWVSVP
jgi:hypothetical protein